MAQNNEREFGEINTRLDHIEANMEKSEEKKEEMGKDISEIKTSISSAKAVGWALVGVFTTFGGLMLTGLYTIIKQVGTG